MTAYHQHAEDVIVVATWAEAKDLGAKTIGGVLRIGDLRVISAAAGPHAVEGMRIASITWTGAALEHHDHERLRQALTCSQAKSRIS